MERRRGRENKQAGTDKERQPPNKSATLFNGWEVSMSECTYITLDCIDVGLCHACLHSRKWKGGPIEYIYSYRV